MRKIAALVPVVLLSIPSISWGVGFENDTLWSGQYAGEANAVVGSVSGSQSIYFNPAGLAGQTGAEVSGNISPTWLTFQGPVAGNVQNSKTTVAPIFGVTASYGLTPQWGVGIGIYTSGGGKAIYDPVDFTSIGLPTKANLESDLTLTEFAVGTGYEILPGLKVGVAWRGVLAKATMALPNINTASISQSTDTTFSNLDQFAVTGYKVGAQWTSSDKDWNLGVNYRSNVNFDNVSGTFTTTALANGSTVDTGTGSLATALPSQLSLGVMHVFSPSIKAMLQYDWTNYSKVNAIKTTTVGPVTGTTYSQVTTGWKNTSSIRVGAECTAVQDWAFRAGYVFTTPAVPDTGLASPIFTAPGSANTFTLGAGRKFSDSFRADAAFGYTHASGTGAATNPGEYADTMVAAHLGATVYF